MILLCGIVLQDRSKNGISCLNFQATPSVWTGAMLLFSGVPAVMRTVPESPLNRFHSGPFLSCDFWPYCNRIEQICPILSFYKGLCLLSICKNRNTAFYISQSTI